MPYWGMLFLIVQIILYQILKRHPELVERFYSNLWFVDESVFLRDTFGEIPVSVGDCLYFLLIFFVLKWFYLKRKKWRLEWQHLLLSMVNFCAIFYFIFHLLWGFNYYRTPLSEKMFLSTDYSEADLIDFTTNLISKTNDIQFQITQNTLQKVIVPYSEKQLLKQGLNGYQNLSENYPCFDYQNISVKASLFSKPLSYMGFGGYLNPFTLEAQVNSCMPKYSFLMTVSHEMAHQIGYANESECNFIGYLAATKNNDLYAQYSGYSFALHYCLSVLKLKNMVAFTALKPKINLGILKNFEESRLFWKAHESIVETGFKIFYDHFLKINNQKDGVRSYGKFLNLLINYEKEIAISTKMLVQ